MTTGLLTVVYYSVTNKSPENSFLELSTALHSLHRQMTTEPATPFTENPRVKAEHVIPKPVICISATFALNYNMNLLRTHYFL